MLEQLTAQYDLVILDSAPISVVSDAIPLVRQVSGVVIVGQVGATTRDGATRLMKQLHSMNAPVLGLVANRVRDSRDPSYGPYGAREISSSTAG